MIRVVLPYHLRTLVGAGDEVPLEVGAPATLGRVLDALEVRFPALRGTIRDRATAKRRPFIRLFAGAADLSNAALDAPLPEAVASGAEPLVVVGAIAGG